jgi:ATP-binding cassette subfamily B protein
VSERIGRDLRTSTYQHLLGLSLEYFGGKRTGDLMARIGSETDRINVFLSLDLLNFATDVLMIAMTAVILFSINPWLALVTLHAAAGHRLDDPLRPRKAAHRLREDRPSLGRGDQRARRHHPRHPRGQGLRPGEARSRALPRRQRTQPGDERQAEQDLVAVLAHRHPAHRIGLLVVWAFGIWQISKNEITVGVLTAFLAYIGRFYTRLDSMSRIVSATQRAASSTKRIFDILDHVSSVPEPTQAGAPDQGDRPDRVEEGQLPLRHPRRDPRRRPDIQPGEMIGLVGHSGSGKSTLVNLICRFYDVTEGAVLIDGVDVRSVPVAEFRRHIGLVLQEPFLFFGTIAENIAYGKPEATRQEIIAAARAAHAHEFILRLAHGYDSLVGERGQGLSGGERQRISIARALLIDPKILILDEATSSVDTETEKEIQKALDNLVRGRTTIAIAHRLSTLRKADRLVVMDRGRLVELGNHDQLMAAEGHYYKLYMAQARNVDAEDMLPRAPDLSKVHAE